MKNNLFWLSLGSLSLTALSGFASGCTDSLESVTNPATAAAPVPSTQTALDAVANAASAEIMPSGEAAINTVDPAHLAQSRLALTVVGPFGTRYHLVYIVGQGWQFVDPPSRSGIVKVKPDGTFAPAVARTSDETHPQTVFIDGPTGYTFVWVEQGGWKFVGNIATTER